MGRTIAKEKGLALTAAGNGQFTRTMPRVPISSIIIRIGTTPTVSAGTWVATTSVNGIKIRYNGVQIIDWSGLYNKDDQISMGMQMLREWNKHMYQQAESANNFVITFPNILPPGDLSVTFDEQSAENQGADSSETISTGTHDILYVTEPKYKRRPIIPYITTGIWSHGTDSGDKFHFLPATLKGFKLHALILATHDAGTLGDTELNTIRIMLGGTQLFEGTMADLKSDFQRRRGVINTVATGMFIYSLGKGGIVVPPDSLQLVMNISAAASSEGLVDYAAISYG